MRTLRDFIYQGLLFVATSVPRMEQRRASPGREPVARRLAGLAGGRARSTGRAGRCARVRTGRTGVPEARQSTSSASHAVGAGTRLADRDSGTYFLQEQVHYIRSVGISL